MAFSHSLNGETSNYWNKGIASKLHGQSIWQCKHVKIHYVHFCCFGQRTMHKALVDEFIPHVPKTDGPAICLLRAQWRNALILKRKYLSIKVHNQSTCLSHDRTVTLLEWASNNAIPLKHKLLTVGIRRSQGSLFHWITVHASYFIVLCTTARPKFKVLYKGSFTNEVIIGLLNKRPLPPRPQSHQLS